MRIRKNLYSYGLLMGPTRYTVGELVNASQMLQAATHRDACAPSGSPR